MAFSVDPNVLRALRTAKNLSQAELARHAQVDKQTIWRLEQGMQQARGTTVRRLCSALDTNPEELAGRKASPKTDRPSDEPSLGSKTQLNLRIGRDIRNAISLVALRYRVPATRIIETAALAFLLQAEASLRRRRERLDMLQNRIEQTRLAQTSLPHLPPSVGVPYRFDSDNVIAEENKSISGRDILGEHISDEVWSGWETGEYDEEKENPFAVYLKDMVNELGEPAEFDGWSGRKQPAYRICRNDATVLFGSDDEAIDAILEGWVLLHEMPTGLLQNGPAQERANWVLDCLAIWRQKSLQDLEPEIDLETTRTDEGRVS